MYPFMTIVYYSLVLARVRNWSDCSINEPKVIVERCTFCMDTPVALVDSIYQNSIVRFDDHGSKKYDPSLHW